MAERIAHLQSECGLSTSVEEFKEQYHFGLVEAVFEWARGMPFSEITNLTDVQEGALVKSFSPKDVAKGLYGAVKPPYPPPHPTLHPPPHPPSPSPFLLSSGFIEIIAVAALYYWTFRFHILKS